MSLTLFEITDPFDIGTLCPLGHTSINAIPKIRFLLFQRERFVRVERTVNIGHDLRLFRIFSMLIGIGKTKNGGFQPNRIMKGGIRKRADPGIERPNMRFRINDDTLLFPDPRFNAIQKISVRDSIIRQRNGTERGCQAP